MRVRQKKPLSLGTVISSVDITEKVSTNFGLTAATFLIILIISTATEISMADKSHVIHPRAKFLQEQSNY